MDFGPKLSNAKPARSATEPPTPLSPGSDWLVSDASARPPTAPEGVMR